MLAFLRSGRFVVDALGIGIAAIAFYVSTKVGAPFVDMLGGVGSSVLFAAALDLLIAAQGYVQHRRQQRMFGRELVRDVAVFAYPDFIMNDDVAEILAEQNQQLLYRRPRSRYAARITHRIDIPRVVASNDIRALLYVSDVFKKSSAPTEIVLDRSILRSAERSFVSFGLSSNDCTHLYLDLDHAPLFEIVPDGTGSEYLRIPADGAEYKSSATRQYGMILRFAPDLDVAPHRRWFFVAGLGPLGTTSAAKFLAQRWQHILKHIGSSDDFVVIVSTGVGSEDYPHLEAVYRRFHDTGVYERIEA